MQVEDWLNVISKRKALTINSRGVELIDKPALVIMQDNDIPRLIEVVRVLCETMQQIDENFDNEEAVELLVSQIESYVFEVIEMDPFKEWGKKKRRKVLKGE